jgi:transposase
MSIREKKGLDIANQAKITRKGNLYVVPSQGGRGQYTVDADAERCSCPDFEYRRAVCKHLYAVSIYIERTKTVTTTTKIEQGKTITETVSTETVKVEKRATYTQNWPSYNKAQTHEKSQFLALLFELCQNIEEPVQTFGRPRQSLSDILFGIVFRTYSTFSGRRFTSDLREAHARGYLSKMPSYNSLFDYLKMESLTPYLQELIKQSSLPLKSVETDFAVDSSGFSTCNYTRWFDVKYGGNEDWRDWIKLHLMCGVKTNIVTSVEVSKAYSNDSPYFKPLLDKTAQSGFTMKEVSADKAYLSSGNMCAALKKGTIPYIPFKTNSQPDGNGPVWARLYHFYNFQRDEFLAHYHKRSNVETTFSMIKSKFGERLRCKTETAQINEALCKVLAHNLCCVIQSVYELGVDATFRTEFEPVRKVG